MKKKYAIRSPIDAPESLSIESATDSNGTPAFVVGDQIISGAQLDVLKAAIAKAKAGA